MTDAGLRARLGGKGAREVQGAHGLRAELPGVLAGLLWAPWAAGLGGGRAELCASRMTVAMPPAPSPLVGRRRAEPRGHHGTGGTALPEQGAGRDRGLSPPPPAV